MSYRVSLKESAEKALARLPRNVQGRIITKIVSLGADPRPPGCVKLAGAARMWRIRVGDYRIVYLVDDPLEAVDVRIVAHRREVYRDL
ncbi:MAG: type II toxin-antitoxin system RelE/ParE family toxin [Tepidisphaeraceae bacterium]|jgi:mRNA interferase RelE/StbE